MKWRFFPIWDRLLVAATIVFAWWLGNSLVSPHITAPDGKLDDFATVGYYLLASPETLYKLASGTPVAPPWETTGQAITTPAAIIGLLVTLAVTTLSLLTTPHIPTLYATAQARIKQQHRNDVYENDIKNNSQLARRVRLLGFKWNMPKILGTALVAAAGAAIATGFAWFAIASLSKVAGVVQIILFAFLGLLAVILIVVSWKVPIDYWNQAN